MNIVQIQEQLKDVPDQALIGYVQNPTGQVPSYLALSELQRRKQMRQQAAVPQQQAPQQSVAEQAVGEATQGVASLPVQNVGNEQAYATGGIVAFEGGGQARLKKADRDYWDAQEEAADKRSVFYNQLRDLGANVLDLPGMLRYKLTGGVLGKEPGYDTTYADRARKAALTNIAARQAVAAEQNTPTPNPVVTDFMASQNAPQPGAATMALPVPAAPVAPTIPSIPAGGSARVSSGGGSRTAQAAAAPAGVASLLKYTAPEDMSGEFKTDPVGSAEDAMARYQQLLGEDPNRAAMNERLAKMEANAAEQERIAPWMAVMKAGLATAAGKSPFALQNLGAGAIEGVNDYTKSQEKLNALEEKRFDIASKLAQADRAEKVAAATYGLNSEEADKARVEKNRLAKLAYKTDRASAIAKGTFDADKANLEAQLQRDKLAEDASYHRASIAAQRDYANKELQMITAYADQYLKDNPGATRSEALREAYKTKGAASMYGADTRQTQAALTALYKRLSDPLLSDDEKAEVQAQINAIQAGGGAMPVDGTLPQGITVRKNK